MRVSSKRLDGELEGRRLRITLSDALRPFKAEMSLQGFELVVEVFVALLTHAMLDVPRCFREGEAGLSEKVGCWLGKGEFAGYYSS